MNSKSIFASKTFWFNALTAAALLINQVTPIVTDPAILKDLAIAAAVANIALRMVTSQPVTVTGSDQAKP